MNNFSDKIVMEGLTFDDVLLIPARSEIIPRDVNVSSMFTREIPLSVPIVSAAMDTVTEYEMAIAMARSGGIGVIHKNMPIDIQADQVRKVKRAENGMIYDPVTIKGDQTVGDALKLMKVNHIGGIPVVDNAGYLVGIVTNRDLRFQHDPGRPISEVMTRENLVTCAPDTDLPAATEIIMRSKVEKLPVVDKDGKLVGLITYKDITKIKNNPEASKDSKGRLLVAAAVGINSHSLDSVEQLISVGTDAVVLDTAHGHSVFVLETIKKIRAAFPKIQIVAGNIATAEAAIALKECGVDAVKVGIGPGSICTTRIIAGIGVPQLTAVL
ncbi:MAG: IMP dehydrogenase, partial [Bacteroidales bacterium]|nr:IMP dehydrogenase [Bacteroidales bacterium]